MDIFRERIKGLRIDKKISQNDLANALEISPRNYQKIEYGEINTSAKNLIALADYFGVSLDYLVGRSDEPTIHGKTEREHRTTL
ncbi:hypothetical protein AGMMS49975_29680 [Clostridia bacterium]|nr:hypothetical protein AGMMS49975_29680 [Clostridia bacterium]